MDYGDCMKFKNTKGVDISVKVARDLESVVPDFDNPEEELKRLGLNEEQIKLMKVRYEARTDTSEST